MRSSLDALAARMSTLQADTPPARANGTTTNGAAHANGASPETSAPGTNGAAIANDLEAAPAEFVGTSNRTIGEAVRIALATASRSLHTLDGIGVRVIPQIVHAGATPRFQVTLQVKPTSSAVLGLSSDPRTR